MAISHQLRKRISPRHPKKILEIKPPMPALATKKRPSKKWDQYERFATRTPFPNHHLPSTDECKLAHDTLAALHGDRDPTAADAMNADGVDRPSSFPDPLDGLVYAVLCQATNERNAIRQVNAMAETYGNWTNYHGIADGGEAKLRDVLSCGGLHARKAKMLMSILHQVETKHSLYSLNHLWSLGDEEVMEDLLGYNGVGPKTASCVLSMTLQRQRFVVDTHIYRITGLLGWRPSQATAEETRAHLETRIPDEYKYALHLLFITHGRECPGCKARKGNDAICSFRKTMRDHNATRNREL